MSAPDPCVAAPKLKYMGAALPKVELGHSAAFRRRRVLNWLPLGLTYALGSDRKTLLRAGYNRYVSQMGSAVSGLIQAGSFLSFCLAAVLASRLAARPRLVVVERDGDRG